MSHKQTLRKVVQLGLNHDHLMKHWQAAIGMADVASENDPESDVSWETDDDGWETDDTSAEESQFFSTGWFNLW